MPLRHLLLALPIVACSGPAIDDAGVREDAPSDRDVATTGDAPVSTDAGTPIDAGPPPPNPCVLDGSCEPGTWVNVTPPGVSLTEGACGNYGTTDVYVSPTHPEELFATFGCQGIFHSTDYGQTWTGPVNTGAGAAEVTDCAGGIAVPSRVTGLDFPIYLACIRGAGLGFWRSLNGGVDWTRYEVTPTPDRQDYYAPAIDPYDASHLIMAGHEMDPLVESFDGGETWSLIAIDPGMHQMGGTASLFFIDRGDAAATRGTWLWLAQAAGGEIGTWRTENAGASWTRVDGNEHGHGTSQIFQPDGEGVIFMAGVYSELGWGVLRSEDYGVTWAHVGTSGNQSNVWGTPSRVYAAWSWAVGGSTPIDPAMQSAPPPGDAGWSASPTPAEMFQGPARAAVTHDPDHAIVVAACWQAGMWRYIEP